MYNNTQVADISKLLSQAEIKRLAALELLAANRPIMLDPVFIQSETNRNNLANIVGNNCACCVLSD